MSSPMTCYSLIIKRTCVESCKRDIDSYCAPLHLLIPAATNVFVTSSHSNDNYFSLYWTRYQLPFLLFFVRFWLFQQRKVYIEIICISFPPMSSKRDYVSLLKFLHLVTGIISGSFFPFVLISTPNIVCLKCS